MIHERPIIFADAPPLIRVLRANRIARGLTAEEVAKRIGCSAFTLHHMEAGKKQPGFKVMNRWADVLGFELSLWPKVVA